jgi:hypothetical protein
MKDENRFMTRTVYYWFKSASTLHELPLSDKIVHRLSSLAIHTSRTMSKLRHPVVATIIFSSFDCGWSSCIRRTAGAAPAAAKPPIVTGSAGPRHMSDSILTDA